MDSLRQSEQNEGHTMSRRGFLEVGGKALVALALGMGLPACRPDNGPEQVPQNPQVPVPEAGGNISKYSFPIGNQTIEISYQRSQLEALIATGSPLVLATAVSPIPGDELLAAGAIATMALATVGGVSISLTVPKPGLDIQEPVIKWPMGNAEMLAGIGMGVIKNFQANLLLDLAQDTEFVRKLLVSNFMVINGENGELYVGDQHIFPNIPGFEDIQVADVLLAIKGLNDIPAFEGKVTNINVLDGDVLLVTVTPPLHEDLIDPGLRAFEWAQYYGDSSPLLKRLIERGRISFVAEEDLGKSEDFSSEQISIIEGRVRAIFGSRGITFGEAPISVTDNFQIAQPDGTFITIPVIKGNIQSIQQLEGQSSRIKYKGDYRTPITDREKVGAFYRVHDDIARAVIGNMQVDPEVAQYAGMIGEIRYPGSLLGHAIVKGSDYDVVLVFPEINDDIVEEKIARWLAGLEDDILREINSSTSPASRTVHVIAKFGHDWDRTQPRKAFPFGFTSIPLSLK